MHFFLLVFSLATASFAVPVEPNGGFTNSVGIKMRLIPAGEFSMGAAQGDTEAFGDEVPQHKVRITRPFYIAATEVTQRQYEQVMGTNPSRFKGELRPVERVNWRNAVDFCIRLSKIEGRHYRLPTEAEWEYACRAGSTTRYSFGNEAAQLDTYAWSGTNSERMTHSVATRKANAWGLFDMHGNVLEWCSDGWDDSYYAVSPADDPQGEPDSPVHTARGGAWICPPGECRSSARVWFPADYHTRSLGVIGFRVVVELTDFVPKNNASSAKPVDE